MDGIAHGFFMTMCIGVAVSLNAEGHPLTMNRNMNVVRLSVDRNSTLRQRQPVGWVEVRNPALGVVGLLGFRFAPTQPTG